MEVLLGLLVIAGISIIFHFDTQYKTGIILGIISAVLLAFVMIILRQFVQRMNSETMLTYQLSGGLLALTALMPLYMQQFPTNYIFPTLNDWGWLLVLSWVCSVWAFQLSTNALKNLTAFTVNLTYNLEPVYGIVLAFVVFKENKFLSKWFFVGFALIAASLIIHLIILLKEERQIRIKMLTEEYHKRIVEYYNATENAYKDSWDLNNSLSIHYGYWDKKVRSFPQSLLRMNEVMAEAVMIKSTDKVLDAGCGVGGSSIFMASQIGCKVTGITLSERQMEQALSNAKKKSISGLVDFKVMNYCNTSFADESFDVVWGCESICYAEDKNKFIKESFRLLKPGGKLVVADGFVTVFQNNDLPVIRQWLDGWQVNYLETPARFKDFMLQAGFDDIAYRDISEYTAPFIPAFVAFLLFGKFICDVEKTNLFKPGHRLCK